MFMCLWKWYSREEFDDMVGKKKDITGTKPLNEQIAFKEEQGCIVIPYERRQSMWAWSWEVAGWQHEVFF